MLLLPRMTARFPSISISYSSKIRTTPAGVQDTKLSSPMDSFPTLIGLKPSTSFSGAIRLKARLISKCFGIGLWSKIPSTSFLAFKVSIKSNNSCICVVSGKRNSSNSIPISSQALLLLRTYTCDALSSPTIITASFGMIPSIFR